jgi:TPR repeat protein
MNIDGRSADELVSAGHARRNAGDLPKSAWLFMKAAEAGSATGSIHYGLALRHGLGVARDERRGVAELTAAVGHSVADAGIDLRAAASTGTILPLAQSRAFAKDTALALVELGACALEGAGQPRSPDAALEALRMAACLGDASAQEQLGYLLSKGASSVRKDMREAAMWYRAALDGGANIPGIAWVWKEKYGK